MAQDAVIVGAGHNGLAAAIHLASKGWKVTVVEQAAVAGGAVKTAELTLPGFRHDLYAMNLSMFAGSGFFAAHKEGLLRHGLEFVGVSDSFSSVFPDGRWLGVSTDLDATAARIAAFSEADAEKWRAMAAAFGGEAAHIGGLLSAPIPSAATLGMLWRAWRAKGLPWVRDMVRLLLSSPRAYLDRHFESPQVKALMGAWGLHLDFAPDIAGGAVFPYLESMANQAFGMVLGKGGADTIIRAMVAHLGALGGEVLLGARAVRVTEQGGRASGVELADGRVLAAGRAVIANLHPRRIADGFLPQAAGREAFLGAMRAFRPGPATMMIHIAADALPGWRAGLDLKRFAYVHLAPDFGMMAKAYGQATAGLLPEEPVLVVGQPTAVDPGRAPQGRHVLWVQVRVVPYRIAGDSAGTIAARDWEAAKAPFAERVLGIIERYAPGFRPHILATHLLSPLDLERDDPNLFEGDSLAGSHHLDQNFLFRPAGGWSRWRTPLKDFYMIGASTWPGAGTGAGSGFMLAKMLAGA